MRGPEGGPSREVPIPRLPAGSHIKGHHGADIEVAPKNRGVHGELWGIRFARWTSESSSSLVSSPFSFKPRLNSLGVE